MVNDFSGEESNEIENDEPERPCHEKKCLPHLAWRAWAAGHVVSSCRTAGRLDHVGTFEMA
jgi:hypothetical protein